MHMADALLSPAVGGAMWAGTAAVTGYASRRLKRQIDDRLIPLMGVLGAFIFATQMINFTIPGTGSSGHLGGGMILAVLLGPHAAFLVMASVLTVQALFFADGGLLALGCNIWNLGFYPCYLAYPFIYRPLVGKSGSPGRIVGASVASAVMALQLGAFSVVLETFLSGKSEIPFGAFALLMQPIHLAIGCVEGFVTAGVINYVRSARPEIIESIAAAKPMGRGVSLRNLLITFIVLAVIAGVALSRFASTLPDGLEWSIAKITGGGGPAAVQGIGPLPKGILGKTSLLSDSAFKSGESGSKREEEAPGRTGIGAETSAAGVIGAAVCIGMIVLVGMGIRSFRGKRHGANP